MLPIERGAGQLFHADTYLCDTHYEIDYPLGFTNVFSVRRLRMLVQNYDLATLLTLAEVVLVTADGSQHHLPPTLEINAEGLMECTIKL